MTAAQADRMAMGMSIVFTRGKIKGTAGTVVDVRHDGHHIRVTLASGRTVSTRPGAIKAVTVAA
jgi:ribosomal protein L24